MEGLGFLRAVLNRKTLSHLIKMQKLVEIQENENSIFGYHTEVNSESLRNYLARFFPEKEIQNILDWLEKRGISNLAILKSFWVDESQRNRRIGTSLLERFLLKTNGEPVLLLCDISESQLPGFNLERWYQSWDFEVTPFLSSAGPLMIRS